MMGMESTTRRPWATGSLIAATGLALAIGVDRVRATAASPVWLAAVAALVFLAVGGLSARYVLRVVPCRRYALDVLVGLAAGFLFYAKQTALATRGLSGALATLGFIVVLVIGLNSYFGRRWQLAADEPDPGER